MSFKTAVMDKVLQWVLESKISPVGWLNGRKSQIGNALSIASGTLLALQTGLTEAGICPGWEYCGHLNQSILVIAFLSSLLVKLVGEWHKKDKQLRALS